MRYLSLEVQIEITNLLIFTNIIIERRNQLRENGKSLHRELQRGSGSIYLCPMSDVCDASFHFASLHLMRRPCFKSIASQHYSFEASCHPAPFLFVL